MADIKKIMTTAAANIKAVFGVAKANIKKVGSGGTLPSAGGGTFKEQMGALGAGPTYEFLMDAADGLGHLVNTGTISGNAQDYYPHPPSVTFDEFDGECLFSGVYHGWWSTGVAWSTITYNTDRSWVFVWENTSRPAGAWWQKDLVSFDGGGWPPFSWGNLKLDDAYVGIAGGPMNSTNLTTANGTHTDPSGTATTLLGAIGKRCVLFIIYDHAAAEFTLRWKQTGDAAGHTFVDLTRNIAASPPGSTSRNVKWVGTTGAGSPQNITWRYMAVIDQVISESEADSLFDVAGL